MPATVGRSFLIVVALTVGSSAYSQTQSTLPASNTPTAETLEKLDPLLVSRVSRPDGFSRVIVRASDAAAVPLLSDLVRQAGGTPGRMLSIIGAIAAELPNQSVANVAAAPVVQRIAMDRPVYAALHRAAATVGVAVAREQFGLDGSGVGVAVIDSGITAWHDDLTTPDGSAQRVHAFVDFVNGQTNPYDDYGHGTHVAGIIGGNGYDSAGMRVGMAPGVKLMVLKVLDQAGRGRISDVIGAIGYAVDRKDEFQLRIINLSVGAGVFESAVTDMLTFAAKRAVDSGIVVIASAGNLGKDANGRPRYGGITAPGNAPWVLTVGASSHMGTVDRSDDTVASFSSRGPTAIDRTAKPDLVAPGVGIESLIDPASALFASKAAFLVNGSIATPYPPYLSLSGTSQAAPVVAGIVALMLQANPSLTPNAVKTILQYTAESSFRYDPLTQGAGFVDARGAIAFARFLAAPDLTPYPWEGGQWSEQITWGNFRFRPGTVDGDATAWDPSVTWGATTLPGGGSIRWNSSCLDVYCTFRTVTSGTASLTSSLVTVVTYTPPVNIVWGYSCGGNDCSGVAWSAQDAMAWGTCDGGDTVVWGSTDAGETVVWGSSDSGETVVWGSSDSGETVVWGSSGDEDIVWQPSGEEPEPDPAV